MAGSRDCSGGPGRARAAIALALLLCGAAAARAQQDEKPQPPIPAAPLEAYRADLARMQQLVAACATANAACDTNKVAQDEQVGDPMHGGFAVHWAWLRDALTDANHAKPQDRAKLLEACTARLREMAQQSGSVSADDATRARAAADAVLRKPEFQYNTQPTWWEHKKAQMLNWLGRLFDGLTSIGARSPFLGPLLEWLFFGGAAVGLVFFLIRAAARQRRRVVLSGGAVQAAAWDREATDWADLAARHAAAEEWREAVHCLYWSAIVLLESRRAWRHNPSRTPREYVRLLKPGSAQQLGLRELTRIFERVWYGFGEADRERYESAHASYDRLAAGGNVNPDPAGALSTEAA